MATNESSVTVDGHELHYVDRFVTLAVLCMRRDLLEEKYEQGLARHLQLSKDCKGYGTV